MSKRFLFPIFLALTFLPWSAHALEALASRAATMEVVYASGFYSALRSGILALDQKEGENQPSSMTFTVAGRKIKANLTAIRYGRCGDLYQARLNVPNERTSTDFVLVDYTNIRCRLYVKDTWHATITTKEPDGSVSKMQLTGSPGQ